MSTIFVTLPGAKSLEPNDMMAIDVAADLRIAVYNVDGKLYATDDRCTHGSASLADGELEGFHVICPFHAGSFDIRDGCPIAYPVTVPIRSYEVVERDGQIGLLLPGTLKDCG